MNLKVEKRVFFLNDHILTEINFNNLKYFLYCS